MMTLARALACALALAALAPTPARADGAVATRRMAVVVGANAAAPGRKPLRFAQRDASAVAKVLRDLGGFASDDVRLLFDPRPEQILAALDSALREAAQAQVDTLVLFYYSGHADTGSLYPGGDPLPLVQLRQRLDDGRAAMRIGIIDACRGGGWTGSKGLSASQTFDIEQALDLATEGSVLIASSSGLEDAHESLALRGSFFTHHWNAGLRGAADRNADDKVTVGEAFEYARALTIRDTALETETPQHPSFRFNLRGRGDPPLAELSPGSSVIELGQASGPLQVIHLGTGLLVVELPPGKRRVRVSLSPGRYLVRRRAGDTVTAREVRLAAGRRVAVEESSLSPVMLGSFAAKSGLPEPVAVEASVEPDRGRPPREFHLSYGIGTSTYERNETQGLVDRRINRFWAFQANALLRHGRHLATRLGLGFMHPGEGSVGNGAIIATIGESLSWPLRVRDALPLSSPVMIEPYVAAHVSAWRQISTENEEVPYQVQGGLSGGVRFYYFFAQVGFVRTLIPDHVTLNQGDRLVDFSQPGTDLAFEFGLRLATDFGLGDLRRRIVGD
jgi:hypothetical protein